MGLRKVGKRKGGKRPQPGDGAYRDDWNTDERELAVARRFGPIVFDPCSNATSRVGALLTRDERSDGLRADWYHLLLEFVEATGVVLAGAVVFVNPPFSALEAWIAKCAAEAVRLRPLGVTVLALIPSRVEQPCWADQIQSVDVGAHRYGRAKFHRPDGVKATTAPCPVSYLAWTELAPEVAAAHFRGWGWAWRCV